MLSPRKFVGTCFVGSYKLAVRSWGKAFSVIAAGSFGAFGRGSVVQPPVRLSGESRIAIGDDVFIGPRCWLQVLAPDARIALTIGDGTSVVGDCTFSAAQSITIGERVLIARGVYVADHSHASQDTLRPILDQGITGVAPVTIADGAWLGANVVVCPGVRIGRGAVIGANSVVLDDVPDHTVAVGAPARVVRRLAAVPQSGPPSSELAAD